MREHRMKNIPYILYNNKYKYICEKLCLEGRNPKDIKYYGWW